MKPAALIHQAPPSRGHIAELRAGTDERGIGLPPSVTANSLNGLTVVPRLELNPTIALRFPALIARAHPSQVSVLSAQAGEPGQWAAY
ncbi:hypothetical protein [Neorhodopirellula pilleata]|uniref:hypothetical protein n=1 Tax=Neorhodopirellula pilleata TaxID=2714738 RepID=UPI0011B71111|nr:hypothetical protein [Neorhodopirellula pilleata]